MHSIWPCNPLAGHLGSVRIWAGCQHAKHFFSNLFDCLNFSGLWALGLCLYTLFTLIFSSGGSIFNALCSYISKFCDISRSCHCISIVAFSLVVESNIYQSPGLELLHFCQESYNTQLSDSNSMFRWNLASWNRIMNVLKACDLPVLWNNCSNLVTLYHKHLRPQLVLELPLLRTAGMAVQIIFYTILYPNRSGSLCSIA